MAIKKPLSQTAGKLAEIGSGDYVDPVALASGTRDGTKFLRDDGTWQTVAGGVGGLSTSDLAVSGMVVLDFGTGSNIAVTQILGQTDIGSNSQIDAWVMGVESVDHNAYEHMIVPITVRAGNIVPGVGFEVMGSSSMQLTGQFVAQWVRTH